MNGLRFTNSRGAVRPPIAILGVPFDNVTKTEAVDLIEEMIASREPHYLVTPNVDFLVQARKDVELRRILFEAHLVVCDGTPLVWVSRWLGNPLPERVAGADLVPLLIQIAARKNYRLFLLGAAPESSRRAVERLRQEYPGLNIAGHYSPPFNRLLEMDHEDIRRRVLSARPDMLFVSFGCPKQEKWVAMNYRSLGVPVTAGVGATIDFLAGQVKRAPVWMQRSGTEWIYRLAQEPRRLFRRYITDLWVFGSSILPQWWELQFRAYLQQLRNKPIKTLRRAHRTSNRTWYGAQAPERLDLAGAVQNASLAQDIVDVRKHCVLDMSSTAFVDSTGVGWLIRLQKKLRQSGQHLVLLAPTPTVRRALNLMRVAEFFHIARNESAARRLLREISATHATDHARTAQFPACLHWRGEITAANAEIIWESTQKYLLRSASDSAKVIDLSQVRFIDSTGLGLMVRAKKRSLERQENLRFVGLQGPVRNVVRLSSLEEFLLSGGPARTTRVLSGRG